jgi:hypothetical protein
VYIVDEDVVDVVLEYGGLAAGASVWYTRPDASRIIEMSWGWPY